VTRASAERKQACASCDELA